MMANTSAPIHVLLLTKYPQQGASSRLRFLQYLPGLAQAGIIVDEAPFFAEDYLVEKYAGRRASIGHLARSYLRRFRNLLRSRNFDVIWVEGELFPFLPAWAEWSLSLFGVGVIVDYDDALFHRYDQAPSRLIRAVLGNKIRNVMRYAMVVTVGNDYIKSYAESAGARRVMSIPTVVDAKRYFSKISTSSGPVVGWIGTPITAAYVLDIAQDLERACAETGARLRLIGAGAASMSAFSSDCVEIVKWNESSECDVLASIDVGIMPLANSPWEQGKCGYKLIQYMASGVPVIASYTDANTKIIERGGCGVIINPNGDSDHAWHDALVSMLSNPDRLKKMGRSGRRAVERIYSVEAQLPQLIDLFVMVTRRRGISTDTQKTTCEE